MPPKLPELLHGWASLAKLDRNEQLPALESLPRPASPFLWQPREHRWPFQIWRPRVELQPVLFWPSFELRSKAWPSLHWDRSPFGIGSSDGQIRRVNVGKSTWPPTKRGDLEEKSSMFQKKPLTSKSSSNLLMTSVEEFNFSNSIWNKTG